MRQTIEINITRDDFLEFLRLRGANIPSTHRIFFRDTYGATFDIDFPMIVQWDAQLQPACIGNLFTADIRDKLHDFCMGGRRIHAIKLIREVTGWRLFEAKSWLDTNFP